MALAEKARAEERTKEAREQFERAEKQAAIATAQPWKLHRQMMEMSAPPSQGATAGKAGTTRALRPAGCCFR